jgi:hypothetical protein
MAHLMGLQFKIVYHKGKDNLAAALSWVAHLKVLQTVSQAQSLWIHEVLNSYALIQQALHSLAAPMQKDTICTMILFTTTTGFGLAPIQRSKQNSLLHFTQVL